MYSQFHYAHFTDEENEVTVTQGQIASRWESWDTDSGLWNSEPRFTNKANSMTCIWLKVADEVEIWTDDGWETHSKHIDLLKNYSLF